MNEKPENKRVSYYDWLRMIATFYVVFGHSLYLDHKTLYGGIDYLELTGAKNIYYTSYYQSCLKIVSWIYTFHMPLFFFLSGAVLALKPLEPYKDFVIKKMKRLWIPYLCVGYFFMLPMKFISGFYDLSGLKSAAFGFWRCIESGHLWFLPALFWDMVIFVALYKVLQRIHMQKVVLVIALIMQCTCYLIPKDILGLISGLEMIFWFALGFEFEKRREYWKKYPFPLWLLLLGAGIALDVLVSHCGVAFSYILVIIRGTESCALAQILDICFREVTETRLYKVLTAQLFDIYLYHDPLEYFVLFVWNMLSWPGGVLLILFRTLGVTILSVLIGCWIKNMKRWGTEK